MEHFEHFGLAQDPFRNDPQLRFYFASPQHSDAERRLLRGVWQGKGLSVLVGPVGSGKTMLVRRVLENLDEELFEACLLVMVHGAVDAHWLLARIARELGVEDPSEDRVALLAQLHDRLAQVREEGRRAVVLIDEAQMLDRRETAEELRGLLNLEYEDERMLSLVLAGLPELESVLALDAPLAERIDIRVELARLDPESGAAYLSHRISTAGGDPDLLARDAAKAIAELASGIPRRMNTLADNALYEAYLAGRKRVEGQDVTRAAGDLPWARSGDVPSRRDQASSAASPLREATERTRPSAPARARPPALGDVTQPELAVESPGLGDVDDEAKEDLVPVAGARVDEEEPEALGFDTDPGTTAAPVDPEDDDGSIAAEIDAVFEPSAASQRIDASEVGFSEEPGLDADPVFLDQEVQAEDTQPPERRGAVVEPVESEPEEDEVDRLFVDLIDET